MSRGEPTSTPPRVLTIAGSDSGGGAGIQADLKTFDAHGVYGMSAITAVTAQNTREVRAVAEIPVDVVAAQIDAVFDDVGVDAVKIGMLASAPIVAIVAERLAAHEAGSGGTWIPVVLDPVMVAKSGDTLLADDAIETLRSRLLPLATVVTPNLPELARLTGEPTGAEDERVAAARSLSTAEPPGPAVLAKGGHGEGDTVVDLLIDGDEVVRFVHPRIETSSTHGTGCTLSSAIAARLARGETLPRAVEGAIEYLAGALAAAFPLGRGHGPGEPLLELDQTVTETDQTVDLLVVGAGPTGIAIGADAVRAGLSTLLVDRGPLAAAIQSYPVFMKFFTTRDRLEIADVPFTIPEDKPDRRQALAYYRSVVERYDIPTALYEEVTGVVREGGDFRVETIRRGPALGEALFVDRAESMPGEPTVRRARAVALATGYFGNPRRLDVPGEDLPWVSYRYREPYLHHGQHVVVVGGGNSASEAALDLWRNGARVTLVHRRDEIKDSVKYWVKPDVENRIEEGSITARWDTEITAFRADGVEVEHADEREVIPADAAYVLIGYSPDVSMLEACGVEVDPESLKPHHDPETLESNIPGLYVAGTALAGKHTDNIFIENTRDHGEKIVAHLLAGSKEPVTA